MGITALELVFKARINGVLGGHIVTMVTYFGIDRKILSNDWTES